MRDPVLAAAAAGVASAAAVAAAKWGGRHLLRFSRGLVELGREFGEFREWRRSRNGDGSGTPAGPGPES